MDDKIAPDGSEDNNGRKLFKLLRRYFLTGILVTTPLAFTIWITLWFLDFVDQNVSNLLPAAVNPEYHLPYDIPGFGLLIAILFFILVGWFARNYFGRLTIRMSEYLLVKMPIVSTVYMTVKQVMEMMMGSQARAFREVVLFEYPRKGSWTLGFVTGVTKGEIQDLTDSEVVNIYVPTTPNPTSGFLLFIPKKDLIYIKMSVEDAIKLIVSGGIITPEDKPPV